ncbi:MAG: electron transfer flavoprotein subunit beta/FixA family protein [Thermodesulfobacteriota bacterium]
MDILVLVKQVPETAEADLEINAEGTDLEREDLVFTINEWDNYAVEEAVRLKEAHGGRVTVLTIGDEEAGDVLRRGLAMGCDEAVHLSDEAFAGSDPAGLARAAAAAVMGRTFDLILTGVQSADQGQGQTGALLAQLLDLPFASMVIGLKIKDGRLKAVRELEANTQEEVELPLPAVVSVQSGINQPRYVSIMGIRKVRSIAIDQRDAGGLGLAGMVGAAASAVAARSLAPPQAGAGAEMLTGSLEAVCQKAAGILREKGGLK